MRGKGGGDPEFPGNLIYDPMWAVAFRLDWQQPKGRCSRWNFFFFLKLCLGAVHKSDGAGPSKIWGQYWLHHPMAVLGGHAHTSNSETEAGTRREKKPPETRSVANGTCTALGTQVGKRVTKGHMIRVCFSGVPDIWGHKGKQTGPTKSEEHFWSFG